MPYQSRNAPRLADLMMRQGDIAADRAMQSGNAWAGLARGIAGLPRQIQANRQAEAMGQEQAFDRGLARKNTASQMDERAIKMAAQIRQQATEEEVRTAAKQTKEAISALVDYQGLPEDQRAAAWPMVQKRLADKAGWEPEYIPQTPMPPQWVKGQFAKLGLTDKALSILVPEPEKDQIAAPGSAIVRDGEIVNQVPFKPDAPQVPASIDAAILAADRAGNQAEVQRLLGLKRRATDAGRAPDKPDAVTPTAGLDATLRLRDRFVRETAAAQTVKTQYELMKSSMEAVRNGGAAPGSQGILVTFQKILDPTSVVRESEYARSASGLSLQNRLEGQWMKIQEGGAGVDPNELQKFVDLAGEWVKNQERTANLTKQQIDSIAREYKLDPDNITRDMGDGSAPGTMRARDPQGKLHEAPAGTPLPAGWTVEP